MQDNKCTKWCKISLHKRQRYQMHRWVFRKIVNFDSKWETPSIHTLITVSRFTLHGIAPLYKTSWIIHQSITKKKSIPYHACFLTMHEYNHLCFTAPFPPLYLAQLGHKFTPRYVFPVECVSYWSIILRTGLTLTLACSPNKRQDSRWRTCCIVGCVHAYV